MVDATETPLKGPPPAEVPLENAPLVRVIAQVRYPLIASLENSSFIGPFQEAIRDDYPTLRPEESRKRHARGPKGAISTRGQRVVAVQRRDPDLAGDTRAGILRTGDVGIHEP